MQALNIVQYSLEILLEAMMVPLARSAMRNMDYINVISMVVNKSYYYNKAISVRITFV